MSKPVEPFEISALIDDELDPTRAAEVRAAIEQDPVLHTQFARLAEANHTWAAAARSAQFMPSVPRYALAPSPRRAYVWVLTLLTILLVAGRCATKFATLEPPPGMLIHTLMLAAVSAVVVWITHRAGPEDTAPAPITE